MMYLFFFFQAEDGIRDGHVTGVQTCALPISSWNGQRASYSRPTFFSDTRASISGTMSVRSSSESMNSWGRSEERRVGKECRSRGSREHWKKKKGGGKGGGGMNVEGTEERRVW